MQTTHTTKAEAEGHRGEEKEREKPHAASSMPPLGIWHLHRRMRFGFSLRMRLPHADAHTVCSVPSPIAQRRLVHVLPRRSPLSARGSTSDQRAPLSQSTRFVRGLITSTSLARSACASIRPPVASCLICTPNRHARIAVIRSACVWHKQRQRSSNSRTSNHRRSHRGRKRRVVRSSPHDPDHSRSARTSHCKRSHRGDRSSTTQASRRPTDPLDYNTRILPTTARPANTNLRSQRLFSFSTHLAATSTRSDHHFIGPATVNRRFIHLLALRTVDAPSVLLISPRAAVAPHSRCWICTTSTQSATAVQSRRWPTRFNKRFTRIRTPSQATSSLASRRRKRRSSDSSRQLLHQSIRRVTVACGISGQRVGRAPQSLPSLGGA